jgi:hypothetical protein
MPPMLDDDGADKLRCGCDLALRAGIVIRCEAHKNWCIGNWIHDGENAREYRQDMINKAPQSASDYIYRRCFLAMPSLDLPSVS